MAGRSTASTCFTSAACCLGSRNCFSKARRILPCWASTARNSAIAQVWCRTCVRWVLRRRCAGISSGALPALSGGGQAEGLESADALRSFDERLHLRRIFHPRTRLHARRHVHRAGARDADGFGYVLRRQAAGQRPFAIIARIEALEDRPVEAAPVATLAS